MKLTKEIIATASRYKTPFLLCDIDIIRANYRRIAGSVHGSEVFYAMKANDSEPVLKALIREGCSFDIASQGEMETLLRLGVAPERMIAFNPIKNGEFLSALRSSKVDILAYDSMTEADKIAQAFPNARLLLRLEVENKGSEWPLTKKFGVSEEAGIELVRYAKEKGLSVIGLTFHVGSQCLNPENWKSALESCERVWKAARDMGVEFSLLSLGGGMPIEHLKHVPTIEEIGAVINPIVEERFRPLNPNLRVTIEPGRGLVGDSAVMVSSVVGLADRGPEKWVYIDVGVFNGLMETIENFKYDIEVPGREGEKRTVTIAGPSCDSVDVPFKQYPLAPVEVGDRIYLMNTGAYTLAYGSRFNSFDVPKCYFINETTSSSSMSSHTNAGAAFLKVFYGICAIWWVWMLASGMRETQSNYLFALVFGLLPIIGGIIGFANSRRWGGFGSIFGKALFFISCGLITWGIGQVIFSYYNLFLDIEIPYPSVADASFVLSWPLWGIGIGYLWKAAGAKFGLRSPGGKARAILLPTAVAALSYYLLVVVARGGEFSFLGSDGLKTFFDLAYPVGDLVILTMVSLVYGLSRSHLGGMLRRPVYFLLAGFVLNYVADFSFSYTTTLETFYSANWVDFLFMTTMFALSMAVARLRPINVFQSADEVVK